MNLYGKDERKGSEKQESGRSGRRYLGRICSALGVLCVVASIAGAAVSRSNQAEAAVTGEAAREDAYRTANSAEKEQAAAPEAFPETGRETPKKLANGDRIVLSTATQGAEIYYTVDGSEPLIDEAYRYQGAVAVSGAYGGSFVLKAFAHKEGMVQSATAVFIYRIAEMEVLGEVTAVPGTEGRVVGGDKVLLLCKEPGAEIYYTVNGSAPEVAAEADGTYTPGEHTLKYEPQKAVAVPGGSGVFCISAVAVKNGMAQSPVAQFVYTYEDGTAAPYGAPAPGAVEEGTEVLLQSDQEGAVIYYEAAYGGSEPPEPTRSSSVFTEEAPIVITGDTVIKAFAFCNRQASQTVTLRYQAVKQAQMPAAPVSSSSVVPSGTRVNLPGAPDRTYYTTDGSDPADMENTAVNTGNSVVLLGQPGDVVTVRACTREPGAAPSEEAVLTYQISQYPGGVSADIAAGETVKTGAAVRLSTDVTEGVIYYTLGTGNPAAAGTKGDRVILEGDPGSSVSVKAVAVAPGTEMTGSCAVFDYRLMDQLKPPRASVKDGTVLTGETAVELTAGEGTIYFTLDGSLPTEDSYEYTAPLLISRETTLRAVTVAEGYADSEPASYSYTFARQAEAPKTSAASGAVKPGKIIQLSSATEDARIYYTTDGRTPDPKAEEGVFLYDSEQGIPIQRSVTIKAIAVREDLCSSNVLTLHYKVEEPQEEVRSIKADAGSGRADGLASRRAEAIPGLILQEVTAADIINDVVLGGREGAIPQEASLSVKQVSIPDGASREMKKRLGDEYEFLKNYTLTLYENGERIQPQGRVEIGIPIPEDYAEADILLAAVNEKGDISLLKTRRGGGYAYAEVDYLGNYAVIGAAVGQRTEAGWNVIWILTAAAGVLTLSGAALILRIMVRGKKRMWRV